MKVSAPFMNQTVVIRTTKKTTLTKSNYMWVIVPLLAALIMYMLLNALTPEYEVRYVEYQMEQGDSLFNVIQNMNEDVNESYDVRSLMSLAKEKNDITNAGHVIAGYTYQIPVIKE
jgi:hypothetical protein